MSADLSIQEFYDRATATVREFHPTCTIDVTEKNSFRLKARVWISLSIFMDVFYSVRTRKTSIAVILKGKRVFGIDNLGGWHVHPIRENQLHRPIEEPSLEDLFRKCLEATKILEPDNHDS